MKLRKLQLSGFKTFVDPTTIEFPGELIGVVGPNGCGKSNIVDAIRWVMGELSAKHLRSGHMTDVIFNGSAKRPQSAQASVELIFDNSSGRGGGRFANYAEISMKRQVFADGQNSYFLNGVKCRRKDIVDLLLGTGLGPHSYAVVEQGMVSRIVEAKPDELREFLEEAAGISTYRERRRETENRMRHTEENMKRLQDIRDEIGKRLVQLKRQATQAEKYQTYKSELRQLQAQVRALKWHSLVQKEQQQKHSRKSHETNLEAAITRQRETETSIEKQRLTQSETAAQYNKSYQNVLQIEADIARGEEAIAGLKQQKDRMEKDLQSAHQELNKATEEAVEQNRKLEQLRQEWDQLKPAYSNMTETNEQAESSYKELEEQHQKCLLNSEELRMQMTNPELVEQAEKARIEAVEAHILQLQGRSDSIQMEMKVAKTEHNSSQQSSAEESLVEAEERLNKSQRNASNKSLDLQHAREKLAQEEQKLNELEQKRSELFGRLESLHYIQDTALGKHLEALNSWLGKNHISDNKRLGENIQVNSKWVRAVEIVLNRVLQAVCVDDLNSLGASLEDLSDTGGALVMTGNDLGQDSRSEAGTKEELDALYFQVEGTVNLKTLLSGYRCIESTQEALQRRSELKHQQKWITPQGFIVGNNWVASAPSNDKHSGVVERELLIEEQSEKLVNFDTSIKKQQALVKSSKFEIEECVRAFESAQAHVEEMQQYFNEQNIQTDRVFEAVRASHKRLVKLEQESADLTGQLQQDREKLTQSKENLTKARLSLDGLAKQYEVAKAAQFAAQNKLESERIHWQQQQSHSREMSVQVETLKTKMIAIEEASTNAQLQVENINHRIQSIELGMAQLSAPGESNKAALKQNIEKRQLINKEVSRLQLANEVAQKTLRKLEAGKSEFVKKVEQQRQLAEESRLLEREISVQRQAVEEELRQLNYINIEEILSELDDDAEESDWVGKIETLDAKIRRLGAINLAAIEEHALDFERKQYLDKQYEDLEEAMATLKQAIERMDKETRHRFKDTYEKVNVELDKLFKKLFNGGQATLTLTENDMLTTGVSIMARPPGKRNQNIQLLSGGEKALTALSLIFSIFSLNPAPFCMLDEVDAPLDDTNVIRFSRILEELESDVQFIVISHNKLTLEIMHQLIGVTMNEPGVSRLVTVDIDQAVEMAAA